MHPDNELPDYIMVMLANKKTIHQINNDLQLFLGDNTNRFTEWLQRAMLSPETELGQRDKGMLGRYLNLTDVSVHHTWVSLLWNRLASSPVSLPHPRI